MDGDLINTHDAGTANVDTNTNNIFIANLWNNNYHGKIQDIRIYNRTLSVEEIKILFEITGDDEIIKMKQVINTLYTKGQIKEI
jgi:hypothetical protein